MILRIAIVILSITLVILRITNVKLGITTVIPRITSFYLEYVKICDKCIPYNTCNRHVVS